MTTYVNWSENILNEHLKTNPKWLENCGRVNKYTRARKDGRFIICPKCHQGHFVFHFSWSALSCQHCGAMVDKNQWKVTG